MLTKKIANFSDDLLNTVLGILGEAKKHDKDCSCGKCEKEEDEVEEGYVPTADEPTDANKKTAQKIRDMMAKEKKPVKEDAEQIDETAKIVAHLQKRYGDNIRKSHVRSAASDFGVDASKLAKAVRTKLGKNMLDEEEQIDEISKGTLGRYINKAKDSIDTASYRQGHKEAHGSSSKPLEKKLTKRHKGIETAVGKLTKEESEQIDEISADMAHRYLKGKRERDYDISPDGKSSKLKKPQSFDKMNKDMKSTVRALRTIEKTKKVNEESEQIDELSKGTMGRYINKAATKIGSQGVTAGLKIAADEKSSKNFKDMGKREKGIKLAVSKLTKEEQDFVDSLNNETFEEVEITEARGRPKKAGAKDFTIHPKTKEKLMHNNPEHMKKIEALQKNKVLEKPKIEAGQHIMNQLQKAKTSMTGGTTINFTHGDSKHVSGTHAARLLDKYAGMKPNEKEDFQKKISHSHEQLMKHV
jgi:hypothetical protein